MTNETVFPTTQGTWLRTQVGGMNAFAENPALADAARINANAYVMERYAGPLAVFVRGSSLARLGEPEELVNGFFASRLSDAAFLDGWSRSGMRLRRWLMNGILFYGQGVARHQGDAEPADSCVRRHRPRCLVADCHRGSATIALDARWSVSFDRGIVVRIAA